MGRLTDALFGGSAEDAADAQVDALERAMRTTKEATDEAKREIRPAFDNAARSRLERLNQAQNILKHGFKPSIGVMGQGNMNAQRMLSGAAPQMANAILGNNIDYGQLNPRGISFGYDSFLAGLPAIQNIPSIYASNTGGSGFSTGSRIPNFGGAGDAATTPFLGGNESFNGGFYSGGGFIGGGGGGGGSTPPWSFPDPAFQVRQR